MSELPGGISMKQSTHSPMQCIALKIPLSILLVDQSMFNIFLLQIKELVDRHFWSVGRSLREEKHPDLSPIIQTKME